MTSAKRLRVGLLLDSFEVPAWVRVAIDEVAASSYGRIVVVALTGAGERNGQSSGPLHRVGSAFRQLLWRLDQLADLRIPADRDAFAPRDTRGALKGVPVQRVDPMQAGDVDTFAAEDIAALRAMNLDVVLRFGTREIRGDILGVARSGVWAFRHSENRIAGGPAGFWEVHESSPVSGASLQLLTDDPDGGPVLARTSTATVLTSIKRNRNGLYWKALPLLTRTLERLQRDGPVAFRENVDRANAAPIFYSKRLFRSPGARDILSHAVRRLARLARLVGRKLLTRQQWVLFYGLADDLETACWRLQPLVPPRDRFWADPHVLKVGDRYYVFVEELLFASGKGHVSVIEIDGEGHHSAARKVLEEPHHLSYPFAFEHDGGYFMIPESSGRRTIDLYRASSFPDRWTFVEHLMTNLEAVDVTLLNEGGRWWLFASVIIHPGDDAGELLLYSSDRLIGGEWRLHPASPLTSDVWNSRPAGAILRRNGRLYRPAQDGSGTYGRAIKLNEIVELSEVAYQEQEVTGIEPDWDARITRTHTLAHVGRLTVLDALRPRWKWTANPASPAWPNALATDSRRTGRMPAHERSVSHRDGRRLRVGRARDHARIAAPR